MELFDDDEDIAAYNALNNLNDLEENRNNRRRIFRQSNPFNELSENQFIKHFR